MCGLAAENVGLNRKALAQLAATEPASFAALVAAARRQSEALAAAAQLRNEQRGAAG